MPNPSSDGQNPDKLTESIGSSPPKTCKKKLCFLVKIQLYGILAIAALIFLANFIDNDLFASTALGLAFVFLLIFPFLAIASLIRISLKSEELKGRGIAILILVVSSAFVYESAYYSVPRAKNWGHRPMCATNLKGLGTSLIVYANDNDGILPERWCDQLIEEADVYPTSFICRTSDSIKGESDFCLNKHAVGKKLSELPDDLVLLFETGFTPDKDEKRMPIKNRKSFAEDSVASTIFSGEEKVYLSRWNQVGGPEKLVVGRHDRGSNVLFADGHVEYIKKFSDLNWGVEAEGLLPADLPEFGPPAKAKSAYNMPVLIILGAVCVIITGWIFFKYNTAKYLKFVIFLGLLSAGTGWFFGDYSEKAYNLISARTAGDIAGAFFGLLAGICFAKIIASRSNKLKQLKYFITFATSLGMLTGVVCATLVHIVLMIANKENSPFCIIIGIPHGIFAGAILGAIAGTIVERFYSQKRSE